MLDVKIVLDAVPDYLFKACGARGDAMKTCATCNASHKNTVDRVLRCMGCVAKPDGNSNWRPLMPNNQIQRAP